MTIAASSLGPAALARHLREQLTDPSLLEHGELLAVIPANDPFILRRKGGGVVLRRRIQLTDVCNRFLSPILDFNTL
jgi:hypothetical protein